ncbi:hypothetical protein [Hwanghaeella sp.]|uniref:hypothetical protein n=1 Tax=Hwanghaeella sp. TaxID=2605943 RepID=UPI003CCC4210
MKDLEVIAASRSLLVKIHQRIPRLKGSRRGKVKVGRRDMLLPGPAVTGYLPESGPFNPWREAARPGKSIGQIRKCQEFKGKSVHGIQ